MDSAELLEREARHGERMIELKIRFWTNDIAQSEGAVRPKHAWSSGVVRMESNPSHDVVPPTIQINRPGELVVKVRYVP